MQYLNPLDMDKQTAKLRMPHCKQQRAIRSDVAVKLFVCVCVYSVVSSVSVRKCVSHPTIRL